MLLKAEILADSLKVMETVALVPGETDFALGYETFRKLMERAGVTTVASNLKIGDAYPYPRSIVHEVAGVRFGIIGLLDPTTAAEISKNGGPAATIEDPATTAQALVKELDPKVDAILAITHLGLQADGNLAAAVPEIDFIIGGHSKEILGYPNQYGKTLVYQAGKQGKYIGWVRLKAALPATPAPGGPHLEVSALSSEALPVKIEMTEDAEFKTLVDAYHKKAAEMGGTAKLAEQAATAADAAGDVYWGAALCGQCHIKQETWWKSTPHSHAYETLVKKEKHLDMECLSCHTTGFSALEQRMKAGQKTMVDVAGMEAVQCESCHAPGSKHSTPLIRSRALDAKTCTGCHNQVMDPQFDFAKKIKLMACPKNDPLPGSGD